MDIIETPKSKKLPTYAELSLIVETNAYRYTFKGLARRFDDTPDRRKALIEGSDNKVREFKRDLGYSHALAQLRVLMQIRADYMAVMPITSYQTYAEVFGQRMIRDLWHGTDFVGDHCLPLTESQFLRGILTLAGFSK